MYQVKQRHKKMKLHHLLLLNLIVLINIGSVTGQDKYTLSEFITLGLENNYALQIARNRQEIAENNFSPGNAGFFPVLDLSLRHSGNLLSTRQSFADGGSTSSSGILNTTNNAGINLGWNLFSGFRVQTTYRRLEELMFQGELSTRLAIENFIAQTTSEYYNYIQQSRQLSNLAYAVSLSRERHRIDEERYLIGSGSRMQMLQSRVFLNADSSRLSRQYEVLRASQIRLNELIGVDNFDFLTGPSDTVINVNPDLHYDELLYTMVEENAGLLLTASNQVISEHDRELIRSRTYPFIILNSGYGYTINTFQAGNLNHQQTIGMNYGLTVGINLFDGFNRRRELSNAAIEINNRELSYNQMLQEIRADLLTIYKVYENNLRLLQMEHENLETARENMEIAFERYRLGALAGIELREVQQSLLEAEERLLSIQYQAKLAEISLLRISGRIMEYI
jgi:outer membrane protein, adhesin transport system